MKRLKAIAALLLISTITLAQDSTKVFYQEIGFNAVRILSQFTKLNSGSVAQLPYDVFYNMYYKNKAGIRLGAGSTTAYYEDGIDKQEYPKVTKSNSINLRIGTGYNFSVNDKVVLNAFLDFAYEKLNNESVSSTTLQTFPGPVLTHYEKNTALTTGLGFRAGTGIKLNVYKQLSLYFELPFTFMREKIKTNNLTKETGIDNVETNIDSRHFNSYFTLPATLYVVLRF